MVRVTRAIEFAASLRYWREDWSADENAARFGAKARQHGHNYRLEVTLAGEPDPVTGMVMNLVDLKEILEREVMARFDHKDLNADTEHFEKEPPTPENFARVLFELLDAALPAGQLERIRLHQDAELWVDATRTAP
ncbi:MAG: 6-carboxytetrahydropterin synthase [Proteobacteria bacterium]|nr:6-carboxytetrahydropterin synthase [Pseudomonadota bacterium]